jgi:hypothetical protein
MLMMSTPTTPTTTRGASFQLRVKIMHKCHMQSHAWSSIVRICATHILIPLSFAAGWWL